MIFRKEWEEFRSTGLLMFVNTFLQIFGWSIVIDFDEDKQTGEIKNYKVYPVRTKFRGFSNSSQEKAYIKLSKWMNENSEILLKEAKEK